MSHISKIELVIQSLGGFERSLQDSLDLSSWKIKKPLNGMGAGSETLQYLKGLKSKISEKCDHAIRVPGCDL